MSTHAAQSGGHTATVLGLPLVGLPPGGVAAHSGADAGHELVEDDRFDEVVIRPRLETLDAIGRLEGVVSGLVERPDEEAAHGRLVVDDKHRTGCGLERSTRLYHPACPARTRRPAAPSASVLKGFARTATPSAGMP